MNAHAAQNAGGDSQPAPASGPQGSSNDAPLIRPEQIQLLRLDDATKKKYSDGLAKMWNVLESTSPESAQHKTALVNLQNASDRIRAQYMQPQQNQGQA